MKHTYRIELHFADGSTATFTKQALNDSDARRKANELARQMDYGKPKEIIVEIADVRPCRTA